MSLAIAAVIRGDARPAALVGDVKPNDALRSGDLWTKFVKRKPGDYLVSVGEGDVVNEETHCSSAFEAKLTCVEALIDAVRARQDTQAPDEGQEQAPAPRVVPHTRTHRR